MLPRGGVALPACQLGELNQVAQVSFRMAMVAQVTSVGGIVNSAPRAPWPLVVPLDVVGQEHDRGLVRRLLIRFRCGLLFSPSCSSLPFGSSGEAISQPAIGALTEIGLLGKAQRLRIEAQGFDLVVHVHGGHLDFHFSLITFAVLGCVFLSSLALVLPDSRPDLSHDPCGRGGVREHLREPTSTDGTEPARHPPPEMVQVSVDRGGVVHPRWTPRNRPRAAPAGALTQSAAAYEVDARSLPPTVATRPAG